jgi:hypothetical protein
MLLSFSLVVSEQLWSSKMCDAVAVEGSVTVKTKISPDIVKLINIIGVMGIPSPKTNKSTGRLKCERKLKRPEVNVRREASNARE